ncbi:MAG: superinfection exclusion B family protein [Prosthecobacter sp.]|jgi:hypothetical protein|uniref:super-infection exclusion protein B n=1 Tax=Prosthecobacter sp. TaxID=1965333 RepID=UPI001A04CFB4|nr:super-infection exclusion protein B [Prosthecobacter sp.]MBE2282287.1 superinfection exclusion B family protein [Prosthecobacter sp.]
MEIFAKAIEFLKLPVRHTWTISLASGFVLFAPESVLKLLRIDGLKQEFGTYVGLTFLVSTLIVSLHVITSIWAWIQRRSRFSESRVRTMQALAQLDPKEKAILREFYIQGQNTLQMPVDQAVVSGLIAKGVLCRVGTMGERSLAGLLFPVQLTQEADALVTSSLIEMPDEPISDHELDFLRKNRPEFLAEIDHHNNIYHTSWERRRIWL